MSEKILPVALSFNTNRYSRSDLVPKSKPQIQSKPTVVLSSDVFDYGDVFEKRYFESGRLYSWEGNGKVKGLFEGKNRDNFVSLTRTSEGGIFEKIKNGTSTMLAKYTRDGRLEHLVEVTPEKMTFISRTGKLSESTGAVAKAKLQNIIKGVKVV